MDTAPSNSEEYVHDKLLLDVLSRTGSGAGGELAELESSLGPAVKSRSDDLEDSDGGSERIRSRRRKSRSNGAPAPDRDPDRLEVLSESGVQEASATSADSVSEPHRESSLGRGFGFGWLALGFLLQLGFLAGLAALLFPRLETLVTKVVTDVAPTAATVSSSGSESVASGAVMVARRLHPELQDSSELEKQLRILKERTRLTGLADLAIAEADRSAYDELLDRLESEAKGEGVGLVHAAQVELLRVKFFYNNSNRLGPYRLPVEELFSDPLIREEADLSTSQFIGLLDSGNSNWAARARAAQLLGGRSNPLVNKALVEAMDEENHLEVLRELAYSFQQNTGYRGDIFDVRGLKDWWDKSGSE